MKHVVLAVAFLGLAWACGRAELPKVGELDGPCYGNRTCNDGLRCSGTNVCVDAASCVNTTCTACPPEMVPISGQPACIDRFEATLYGNPDCTGTRYGANGNDLPAGFPWNVESEDCTGLCFNQTVEPGTVDLYACSVEGVRPSAFASWFQAARACQNSGKHLCTAAERFDACAGLAGNSYPYGATFEVGACNDDSAGVGGAVPTGSRDACEGSVAGLFDATGNLAEWLGLAPGDPHSGVFCNPAGGDYGNAGTSATCTTIYSESCASSSDSIGFRCCADSP